MPKSWDVIVVGGGVFGASAALELRGRGHAVSLLDPGPLPHPDASSTDISKVVRADYGDDVFYTELMEGALSRWRAWNDRFVEPLFHETGFALLTRAAMREGSFEALSFQTLRARGHRLERLDEQAVHERFPALAPGVYCDGYYNPSGGWARSGEVVAELLRWARDAGVDVQEGERVVALLGDARVRGVRTEGGERHADRVVIAAGAWTPALVPELGRMLTPTAQPVLHFRPADVGPFRAPSLVPWGADISQTGWYGFCANHSGVVKVAHHGPGERLDPQVARVLPEGTEARFREFLSRSFPALARAPKVHERLCFYCDSADGDLLVDRHPERAGLVVAAGGSGHAFKLAPLLGELIADVCEAGPAVPRFAWRHAPASQGDQARMRVRESALPASPSGDEGGSEG